MTGLADAVLPLIRTRTELYRWSAANAHGRDMHEAVDILESAIPTTDPTEIYAVTHKALASAIKVIARADDSSGIIGDACRRLLDLHPKAAASAKVPAGKLVDWMIKFQFDGEVDYFELDPVAYSPARSSPAPAAVSAVRRVSGRVGRACTARPVPWLWLSHMPPSTDEGAGGHSSADERSVTIQYLRLPLRVSS